MLTAPTEESKDTHTHIPLCCPPEAAKVNIPIRNHLSLMRTSTHIHEGSCLFSQNGLLSCILS